MKIEYTRYQFNPPLFSISIENYEKIRQALKSNPNFSLIDEKETMFNEFKWKILFCILTIPIFGIGLLYLIVTLFEMLSFSRYLKHKRNYYENLVYDIKRSRNYEEFHLEFYGEEPDYMKFSNLRRDLI